jgi:hypothetical protein
VRKLDKVKPSVNTSITLHLIVSEESARSGLGPIIIKAARISLSQLQEEMAHLCTLPKMPSTRVSFLMMERFPSVYYHLELVTTLRKCSAGAKRQSKFGTIRFNVSLPKS